MKRKSAESKTPLFSDNVAPSAPIDDGSFTVQPIQSNQPLSFDGNDLFINTGQVLIEKKIKQSGKKIKRSTRDEILTPVKNYMTTDNLTQRIVIAQQAYQGDMVFSHNMKATCVLTDTDKHVFRGISLLNKSTQEHAMPIAIYGVANSYNTNEMCLRPLDPLTYNYGVNARFVRGEPVRTIARVQTVGNQTFGNQTFEEDLFAICGRSLSYCVPNGTYKVFLNT
jgi:hypothetical protein